MQELHDQKEELISYFSDKKEAVAFFQQTIDKGVIKIGTQCFEPINVFMCGGSFEKNELDRWLVFEKDDNCTGKERGGAAREKEVLLVGVACPAGTLTMASN